MVVLVSDTSVLIDLDRGGLFIWVFGSFQLAVPDLLFERELRDWVDPDLLSLGLMVLSLDGEGVALAQSYRKREPKLSLPDAFALALAKTGRHVLLAGDASLRALAAVEEVEVHGVLWLIDELEARGVEPAELARALGAIVGHPRCRLPRHEVQRRLTRLSLT